MIGDCYKLIGTDEAFMITGEQGLNWTITIKTLEGHEVNILMSKQDLIESITEGTLAQI